MGCVFSKVEDDSYVYDTELPPIVKASSHQAVMSKSYFKQFVKRVDGSQDAGYTEILA
jgi:hypothetical protein